MWQSASTHTAPHLQESLRHQPPESKSHPGVLEGRHAANTVNAAHKQKKPDQTVRLFLI
jgi:hypothetical protein